MSHALDTHRLAEVGDRRRATLEQAGFPTLEALAGADADRVAALPGFHAALAARLVHRAAAALAELAPAVPAAARLPNAKKGPSVRKRRKAIGKAIDRLGEARAHARGARAKSARRRARRALRATQRQLRALADGLDANGTVDQWAPTERALRKLVARLARFLDRRPGKGRLRKVRRAAAKASAALE